MIFLVPTRMVYAATYQRTITTRRRRKTIFGEANAQSMLCHVFGASGQDRPEKKIPCTSTSPQMVLGFNLWRSRLAPARWAAVSKGAAFHIRGAPSRSSLPPPCCGAPRPCWRNLHASATPHHLTPPMVLPVSSSKPKSMDPKSSSGGMSMGMVPSTAATKKQIRTRQAQMWRQGVQIRGMSGAGSPRVARLCRIFCPLLFLYHPHRRPVTHSARKSAETGVLKRSTGERSRDCCEAVEFVTEVSCGPVCA